MRVWCNKYVQFVNIIIKINILRNVCLNKSYLYINVFYIFLSCYSCKIDVCLLRIYFVFLYHSFSFKYSDLRTCTFFINICKKTIP